MLRIAVVFAMVIAADTTHATLVAMAPSRDGLAIASDSRLTFMGAQCDGAFKILHPARIPRTIAVVTGDAVFVAPPPSDTRDLCEYLAGAPRLLDMNAIVTGELEKAGEHAAQISMEGLSAQCVRAVEQFRASYPQALRNYAGRDIFAVVVAAYDPENSVAIVRRFLVRMTVDSKLEAAQQSETKFDAPAPSDVLVFGESDWVKQKVLAGTGQRFLSASTIDFLSNRRPVAEVSKKQAVFAVADVIEAATRAAELDPPPSGIGGAIQVVVIGAGADAH